MDEFTLSILDMLDKIRSDELFKNCPIVFAIESTQPIVTDIIIEKISLYKHKDLLEQHIYFMAESGNNVKGRRIIGVPKNNDTTILSQARLKSYINIKIIGFRVDENERYNFYTYKNNCISVVSIFRKAMLNFIPVKTKRSITIHGKIGGENDDVVICLMMIYWMEIFMSNHYYDDVRQLIVN